MELKGFDKNIAIDQEEVLRPKMVTVEIAGKKYEVPEGITVIKALWYSGQEVIRGAGCLGGFCGLRDVLPDQGRSQGQDLPGLLDSRRGRHVVYHGPAFPRPQSHLSALRAERPEAGPL